MNKIITQYRIPGIRTASILALFAASLAFTGCAETQARNDDSDDDSEMSLVEKGEKLFLEETFGGNGRTCATCHRPTDNFGLTPDFIASLPDDDPLFVAETVPGLAENFENPLLMRSFAMIVENLDGFMPAETNFTLRGVPHTLGMRVSIDSADGPRLGWSGDGAPGDGSLRSFAIGAVIQHFPKTTDRIAGVDFRLPTDEELDALEAFQLSLGREVEITLPLPLKSMVAARGQEIFMDGSLGKCNNCHFNAGANANPAIFGADAGNRNFDTGVEDLPDQPARLSNEFVPLDDGFGIPGNGEFNTPSLVEAADTGPFFHNNSVETIEGSVAFYNGDAFANSPGGQAVGGINLDGTQVVAVAAFLRVINVLENIRSSDELLARMVTESGKSGRDYEAMLERAFSEADDGMMVLRGGGLHGRAANYLVKACEMIERAQNERKHGRLEEYALKAMKELERARNELSG